MSFVIHPAEILKRKPGLHFAETIKQTSGISGWVLTTDDRPQYVTLSWQKQHWEVSCRETDHDGFDSVHEGEAEAFEAIYKKLTQVSMLTWLGWASGIVGLPQQTLHGQNTQLKKQITWKKDTQDLGSSIRKYVRPFQVQLRFVRICWIRFPKNGQELGIALKIFLTFPKWL